MNKMPDDIEALLSRLNDPEDIKRLQAQWMEYARANEAYERNYPQQFGNLIEANLKFKENKTIPTPAEQMRLYNEAIRNEAQELLNEKTNDEVYYEEPDQSNTASGKFGRFKLTFDEMSQDGKGEQTYEIKDGGKLQEYNIEWVEDYYAKQRDQPEQPATEKVNDTPQAAKSTPPYELKLTFDQMGIENAEPGLEQQKEDLGLERE